MTFAQAADIADTLHAVDMNLSIITVLLMVVLGSSFFRWWRR